MTVDYGRPFADRLVAEGMVARTGDALVLTDAGRNLIAKEPAPAEP